MLHSSKLLPKIHQCIKPLAIPIPTRISRKLSRRELVIFTNSSLLLSTTTSHALLPGISKAEQEQDDEEENSARPQDTTNNKAEAGGNPIQSPENAAPTEAAAAEENAPPQPQEPVSSCIDDSSNSPTKRAFLDISIDGQPVGRIIVGIYENAAPFGASRFIELVSGRAGLSYRRKEFIKIMPSYVQHGGIRSYGEYNLKNDTLEQEWGKAKGECPGPRNLQGSVSIVVRDPSKPPPKTKLVARGGKLEIDEEEVGVDPNGTQFVICSKDSPQLDDSALVIGRVLEGMDVVHSIAQLKTVQDNTSSPYFRVAKLIGDKRAVVAERGFNRPYSKVLVTNCGLLE